LSFVLFYKKEKQKVLRIRKIGVESFSIASEAKFDFYDLAGAALSLSLFLYFLSIPMHLDNNAK
jgi:hypothetical protein